MVEGVLSGDEVVGMARAPLYFGDPGVELSSPFWGSVSQ